ncbi:hypothetical protein [Methylotenera sp.]|uniref:hypothetical protein n=1 Tax=Methylotenera sp. TaxID=2051956 RepID=UPI0027197AF7|nr:hypothetical protein [Methylotenera sp.]MDO9234288.1 hypothetical protein [Methylotenera sp.]MDO9394429.1 hypothetical protein [Methylotenera sp.]MDP1521675.1 hypothetical protein [Methylotenera sp.]MDP2070836.1 hypothetical protein [Methylotenera sp.]MDP3006633.1 hypothetical protein [Methylotenera sp.]
MSLDNLLKINQLQVHAVTREAALRLLEAAKRNIADAHISAVSGENRFDAAYKCIMQCAMVALWVNGYRTSTSQPGHHQTAIQTLPTTIGLPQSTVIILDGLRKQRNISDYEGDPVSDQAVIECIKQAENLYQFVLDWIKINRTDLV